MTRGGIHGGISPGLKLYLSMYPNLSRTTDIFFLSKSYTPSVVLPGRAILEKLILCIGLAALAIFSRICPVDDAIQVRIDPVENYIVAALGITHGEKSNIRRVEFQYYPF